MQTIASEKRNLEGANAVIRAFEASSRNEIVIQQAQNEVRSAQASIRFLEDELAKLQMQASTGGSAGPSSSQPLNPYPYNQQPGHGVPPPRTGPTQPLNIKKALPAPPGSTPDVSNDPKPTKNYTQLDLLRYDAPLTGAKITRMLNQLQFKLQLEEQYKLGIEKMAQAYRAEGDKRLRNETEAKRVESDGKIQLLRKAKRRYETLAKFGAVDDDLEGEYVARAPLADFLRSYSRQQAQRGPA